MSSKLLFRNLRNFNKAFPVIQKPIIFSPNYTSQTRGVKSYNDPSSRECKLYELKHAINNYDIFKFNKHLCNITTEQDIQDCLSIVEDKKKDVLCVGMYHTPAAFILPHSLLLVYYTFIADRQTYSEVKQLVDTVTDMETQINKIRKLK